jgi:hypothetical protein
MANPTASIFWFSRLLCKSGVTTLQSLGGGRHQDEVMPHFRSQETVDSALRMSDRGVSDRPLDRFVGSKS